MQPKAVRDEGSECRLDYTQTGSLGAQRRYLESGRDFVHCKSFTMRL